MQKMLTEGYGFMFEQELIDEIVSFGHYLEVQSGDILIDYGQNIKYMPLLLNGVIKILRQDNDGDELLLYYLEKGDTCTMTMNCCIGHSKSRVRAIVEKDSAIAMIPVSKMEEWMATYKSWMTFVLDSYSMRFNEMLEAIDNLAFNNMHDRLFKYLKDKVLINKTTMLGITHQAIAYDLHSSRVVISRLLKNLEKEGKIKLFRNKLEVLEY